MQLAHLETFLAIDDTGSLVRASERLHVSQSTVTARLHALENALGQRLFSRGKQGVVPTAAGRKFKRYAQAMSALWKQAQQETSPLYGVQYRMHLGCEQDLWPLAGQRLITFLRREHPSTALSVLPGQDAALEYALRTSQIDAMLSWRNTCREGQTLYALFREPLLLVSNRPNTSMRTDPHYVYFDAGPDFGHQHTAEFSDAGVAKTSFSSAQWVLDYLLTQPGSAYLPQRLVAPFLRTKQLLCVAGAPAFSREATLIVSDAAAHTWPWLPALVAQLRADFIAVG